MNILQTKNDTPVPAPSTTIQSTSHRSGVIVVDTVKLKEVLPSVGKSTHFSSSNICLSLNKYINLII